MGNTFTDLHLAIADKRQWVLGTILELRARTHADRPFLQYMQNPPLTFAEVNVMVNRIARGLASLGVTKGDRVLLMLPNCLEYLFVWWAANKLGAAEVPVNNAYKGYFLEHLANNSGAKVMVVDQEFLELVAASQERLQHLQRVVVYGRDGVNVGAIPRFEKLAVSQFAELYHSDGSNVGVDVRYYDLAAVMYT